MSKSNLLVSLREKWNLTQKEMSEILEIPPRTYQSWEAGEKSPSKSGIAYMRLLLGDALHIFERRIRKYKEKNQ